MYTIEIAPAVERAIKKLSAEVKKRIIKALLKLGVEPRPPGVKKLSGEEDLYRIRAGDYRIVYQIRDNELVVLVVRVAHRKEVYR